MLRATRAMNAIGHALILLLLLLALPSITSAADKPFFALNTGDLKAELQDARAQGRQGLMLFFEQEGCPGCRHMKQNILNQPAVQDYYGKHFVSLAVDLFGALPMTDLQGRHVTEKSLSQNLKIRATPTFIFYNLSGVEMVRIVGPLETPQDFLLLGEFVTSGAYRTQSFAQYRRSSPRPPRPGAPKSSSNAAEQAAAAMRAGDQLTPGSR